MRALELSLPTLLLLCAVAARPTSSAAARGGEHSTPDFASLSSPSFPVAPSSAAFVHPNSGFDSADLGCSHSNPCRTVAFAVSLNFNNILLAPAAYSEPTITLSSRSRISLAGVGGPAVFDCGLRVQPSRSAPAFAVSGSNASFSNMSFRNCGNEGAFGGAINASFSTISIDACTFMNNRALSGGAVALSAGYLHVTNSVFSNNSALCDSPTCSSAWGGAIVSFDAISVVVSTSTFVSNSVMLSSNAAVSPSFLGTFAVGGGCISANYNQYNNASTVSISDNSFLDCLAQIVNAPESPRYFSGVYGGAVSIYYGLAPSASSPVYVKAASTDFLSNICSFCSASITNLNSNINAPATVGAYGGCLSVFIGNVGGNVGYTIVQDSVFTASRNTISDCFAVAYSRMGAISFGGGVSVSFGSINTNSCRRRLDGCAVGSLNVKGTRVLASNNTVSNCSATAAIDIPAAGEWSQSVFVFGPSTAGGAISIFAANTFIHQNIFGSTNVMGESVVTQSIVFSDDNIVRNCSALSALSGDPTIPALASFSFGGGISVAFGIVALSSSFSTFNLQNSTLAGSFKANGNMVTGCTASLFTVLENVLPFDAIAFGGGISFFVGSQVFANVQREAAFVNFVGHMEAKRNTVTHCRVNVQSAVYGSTVSGGGISLHIGGHSQFLMYNQKTKFFTLVARAPISLIGANSRILCEENVVSNCSASSSSHTSNGGVVRGGGISVLIGGAAAVVSFGYRHLIQAFVAGSPTSRSTVYEVSATKNVVSNCVVAMRVNVSSSGAILSGGGINVMIGASCFSFSAVGSSYCSAGATFFSGSVNLSSNIVSHSSASIISNVYATGSMLLGGCISATVGASILANGQIDSGSTTFSASLVADQNVLSHCMLDSYTNGEEQASSAFGGDVFHFFQIENKYALFCGFTDCLQVP